MLDVNNFDGLKIGLATSDQIRSWSRGEVKKPETINYRTLKPEKDGLFCEKIFGPSKDWECYCGKYKRLRFKGIICERCGVEVTRSRVRRERMGHIELAAPVAHIWYFKGVPTRMGYLLDISPKDLEKIIYFASYIVTHLDEDKRHQELPVLEEELAEEIAEIEEAARERLAEMREELANPPEPEPEPEPEEEEEELAEGEEPPVKVVVPVKTPAQREREIKDLEESTKRRVEHLKKVFEEFKTLSYMQLVADEALFRDMRDRYGDFFRGAMGAEAIRDLLSAIDLDVLAEELRDTLKNSKGQKRQKAIKRLKVAASFLHTDNKPTSMVMEVIPVIPPDLRPMVQLDGGRFATSDLNDLYRRVINRNNRLKRLLDLGAPEIIVNNEKRMLQEAVDALFDNGRRGRAVTGPGNRPLKSLSDMLKGKQGRFRQNLLGKRVDYSGRSVIVVGPELKLHQCGLPKQMALELFKPFVMKRLVDRGYAQNIKSAKRMVERQRAEVWEVLEEVIKEHPVLLNRAPTLHRLGIQAFEPVLVEGKAIQIHPLVCTAFNADFDGDQMAVHLPLSAEAQAEARILMLSAHNILSPAHGRPITTPTQDMVLGANYLTVMKEGERGEGKAFNTAEEAIMAYDYGHIELHAPIKVRIKEKGRPVKLTDTTVGRVIFNQALPDDYPYVNEVVSKKKVSELVTDCANRYDRLKMSETLDAIKEVTFHYATRAGITISVQDITVPPTKEKILAEPETVVRKIEDDYKRGLITEEERHQQVVELWTEATDAVTEAMENAFDEFNPIYMMANSGARGNIKQIRQLAGMRGLVANPKGDIIDRPIKSNFREGLTVLEYFISTHGARKGLADTALRTADSGYLTRRLVDVAQDVIIREDDCGTDKGIPCPVLNDQGELNNSLKARVALEAVVDPNWKEEMVNPNCKEGRILTNKISMLKLSSQAAFFLKKNDIETLMKLKEELNGLEEKLTKSYKKELEHDVDYLKLSVRTTNVLKQNGIRNIGELVGISEKPKKLEEIGLASKGLSEIKESLDRCHLQNFDASRLAAEVKQKFKSEEQKLDCTKEQQREKYIIRKNQEIYEEEAERLMKAGIESVMVRSLMTCEARYGVCSLCYGGMLATGKLVEIGEAVGIIAAQSIGEPGTQLTMRTFHTGGVAGEDITHGLPRVVELFEARKPKGQAVIAEISGNIAIEETEKARILHVTDGDKEKSYQVARRTRLKVREGQEVAAGAQLTEGSINPHEILRIKGPQDVQLYLVSEVQDVYKSQGVDIHDKHVELIVRQMLKRVNIVEQGDTEMLPGQLQAVKAFNDANEAVMADGGEPATARQVLLGITKASLATESFLSAASFQETTRVLTDAAISNRVDPLLGLKENVIIGKLIPAGTGMGRYRNIKVKAKSSGISLQEEVDALRAMGGTETYSAEELLQALKPKSGRGEPIESLELPTRTRNNLKAVDIERVDQLTALSEGEVLGLPNIGEKALEEIVEVLESRGLSLRPPEIEEPTDPEVSMLLESVDELDIPTRTRNNLKAQGIELIGQLVHLTGEELLDKPNIGDVARQEIEEALEEKGLALKVPEEEEYEEERAGESESA